MLKDFFSFLPLLFNDHLLSTVSTTTSMFTTFSIYKDLNTIAPYELFAVLLLCFSFSSFLKFSLVTQDQTAYLPKSELAPENLEKVKKRKSNK
ncbi:hypothetical protein CXB51_034562 [Gossypium anomalum]|uniref:Uncharacterized protein n=1 Tax=Gossypium anomalum TaxID=47600 RepID=A0A8J5Y670_9ROSI|nr:hypothetical protein CXB51_034562 [Gossypium anomalum]